MTQAERVHRLGWPGALVAGWAAAAVANSVVMASNFRGGLSASARALMHLHDLGQTVAAGLIVGGAVWCWLRLRVTPRWRWLATLVSVALVGEVILREDLVGIASRKAGNLLGGELLLWCMASAASLAVLVGAWLSQRVLGRGWLRLVPVVVGALVVVLNDRILRDDYPAAHLLLQVTGASLCAAALVGLPAPPRPRLTLAAIGALAAFAVLVAPGDHLSLALDRQGGAAMAPYFARARRTLQATSVGQHGDDPWFRSRVRSVPTPPSTSKLSFEPGLVVLLLTIDALRADVLEGDVHAKQLPELLSLRDESAWFRNCRAPGSQTVYTLSEMMMGTYFSQQYWTQKRARGRLWLWPHEDPTRRFPQVLSDAGVATVNITAALWMVNDYGVVRGFSEEHYVEPRGKGEIYAFGRDLTPPIVERLKRHGDGGLFLFAHNLDAHAPYDRAGKKGRPFDRYMAELSLVDREIGKIRAAVERAGLQDRTVLIVTSDHGQAFGEHGTTEHAKTLYDELVRVPVLVHGPGIAARTVDEPVTLMDLGPTILDLFGRPTPVHMMGESWVPLLQGEDRTLTRPIVAEGRLKRSMVFRDGIKVIFDQRTGLRELYDLNADPGELDNLVEKLGPQAEMRFALLNRLFEVHRIRRPGYEIPYRR